MHNHSRYKRVKTDYQKRENKNTSFIPEHSSNQLNRSSAASIKEPSILTKVLQQINQQKQYDTISAQDIEEQRSMLRKKLKEMNSKLAQLIEHQWQKRNEEERINCKAIVGREMGVNYHQLCREYVENGTKIKSMEEEFKENNQKLATLSSPDSKLTLSKKIADSELKIKELKESIGRIKKNKFLREREIIRVSQTGRGQISSLQLEYINTAKKLEYLVSRSQKIQEDLADSEYSLTKQKDVFDQLRDQSQKIETTPANMEHMKLLYDSHRKKLQGHQKRNERDQETKKRKYYSLLIEFQKEKKRDEVIECRIYEKVEKIQQSSRRIQALLDELEGIKEERERRDQEIANFMMTEIPRDRVALKLKNQDQRTIKQRHRESTPPRDTIVRKWNCRVQGSIVKQKSKSHHNVTEIQQLSNENDSFFSVGPNTFKKSLMAGQIRHFHTEATPVLEFEEKRSMTESEIEETYPQDFQG